MLRLLLNKQILKPMHIHCYHPVRMISTTTPKHNYFDNTSSCCGQGSKFYKGSLDFQALTCFDQLRKEISGVEQKLISLELQRNEARTEFKSQLRALSNAIENESERIKELRANKNMKRIKCMGFVTLSLFVLINLNNEKFGYLCDLWDKATMAEKQFTPSQNSTL
ncbi:hypothetical protein HOY82DRAFT_616061 [Tuber indicum]|nr:hypothetical protein HOY82DRAFT_616061 [Tuber indicum]